MLDTSVVIADGVEAIPGTPRAAEKPCSRSAVGQVLGAGQVTLGRRSS